MKFKGSVDIDRPLEKVVALFSDPKNLGEYQEGFVRKELLSGNEGTEGAVSKLYYKTGSREMELTETIVANRLPETIEANYHHKHMDNTLKSSFVALGEDRTRYEIEGEYTAFRGFFPKLMALLFPGIFRKQAQKWMDNFKAFAERE